MSAYWMQGAALALFIVLLTVRRVIDRGRLVHRSSGDGVAPDIVVRDRRSGRELWFEQGGRRMLHARVALRNPLVSRLPYIDGLHLHMGEASAARRVLFIGGGAAIGPRQFAHRFPRAVIEVVDVDPRAFDVATRFFWLVPSPTLTTHVGDGRQFLEQSSETFDRIVVDVFGADDMPAALCTQEFFRLCRAKLSRGGTCVVNVAGAIEGPSSTLVRAIHAGVVAAFGEGLVRAYAVPRGRERRLAARRRRNLLIFAFDSTLPGDTAAKSDATELSIVPALATLREHQINVQPKCEPLRDHALGNSRLEVR